MATQQRQPANKPPVISERFIDEIRTRLAQGKRIRRTLPSGGRLHIDRKLPFLVVYRHPAKRHPDNGTERLIKGQASYLSAPGESKFKKGLTSLVGTIVNTLSEEYQACLLIEVWAGPDSLVAELENQPMPGPVFKIILSRSHFPTSTIEAIEKSLKRIRILGRKSIVDIEYHKKQWPDGFGSLLSAASATSSNCYRIGIEVSPVYRQQENGEVLPIVLRRLHQGMTRAIKQGVFAFSHAHTTQRPRSYHALGRRAVVQAVWEVDRSLAEIGNAFGFLLQITPVNIDQAWNSFKRRRFEREPRFYYRPLPIDPDLLKRTLYRIPIERIEDPTLANLFREKRTELELELSMLRDRGTRSFLYGSLQHFGNVSEELFTLATDILRKISPRSSNRSRTSPLKAEDFQLRAQEEIRYYQERYPDMSCQAHVRDDVTGLIVSKGELLIGKQARIPVSRVEALLQHEIGTHALTYYAAKAQPFQLLSNGLAGYEEFQEGLALISEYMVGGFSAPRLRLLAGRVVGVYHMLAGASFIDSFRELNKRYGFEQRSAYLITARIYRGGGFTKDAVYLRGLLDILSYFQQDGEIDILFIGKIARRHIPVMQELWARKVLQPIPLRPRYLKHEAAQERIDTLRQGLSIFDLLQKN